MTLAQMLLGEPLPLPKGKLRKVILDDEARPGRPKTPTGRKRGSVPSNKKDAVTLDDLLALLRAGPRTSGELSAQVGLPANVLFTRMHHLVTRGDCIGQKRPDNKMVWALKEKP